ncbi:MAG TPA: hypothetical protein DCP32_06105 [Anaerolineaceae bacterium]|nr:MAG: hypothetical protein A2X24_01095 [Chloroflexi bacterium GWB2_54_36]HAL16322.1 hypothetical protein [Anaerolineaceae bacterium]
MLERLHEHVISELNQSSRTDTIFVVVAVVFNLIALGINSAIASNDFPSTSEDIVLAAFIVMTVLVNTIAILGLYVGRLTRTKLLAGLVAMYQDNQIDKYYDQSLVLNYGRRYVLFGAIILVLALTALVVPLTLRVL